MCSLASATAALAMIAACPGAQAGEIVHNPDRAFSAAGLAQKLPYERLGNPRQYLGRTFLGQRTAGYQAALGCRFRCTFCGVAAMFRGKTALPPAARLEQELRLSAARSSAWTAIQFYDHNFFDREVDMVPLLEVLAQLQMPWWCFARADALLNLSEQLLGAGAGRAGCAWRTSAPNLPATGCCTTSARAPVPIRRSRPWRSAAVMA